MGLLQSMFVLSASGCRIKHACIAPPVLTALLLQAEAVSAVDLPHVEVVLLTDAARNHASGITNPSNTLLNPYPQSKAGNEAKCN